MSDQVELNLGGVMRSAWAESWHNSKLRFCDVPPEHLSDWLNETAQWLLNGRRWPLSPNERQIRHCIHWWPRVYRLMQEYGWWPELTENNLVGYVVTWRLGENGEYELAQGAPQAHYAAVVGAAIVRRKAKYYRLWERQGRQ